MSFSELGTSGEDEGRWWEREGWPVYAYPYVVLLQCYLRQSISASEFELLCLQLFEYDARPIPDAGIGPVLGRLFTALDEYCGDPRIRAATGGVDEAHLHRTAESVMRELARGCAN